MNKECFVSQSSTNDCGIACLLMIFKLNNINANYNDIKNKLKLKDDGISAYDIVYISNSYNLKAEGYKNFDINNFCNPLIAHIINDNKLQHFIVVLRVEKDKLLIADPSTKIMYVTKEWFINHYTGVVIRFQTNKNDISFLNIFKNKKIIISIILITILLAIINILNSYTLSCLIKLIEINTNANKLYLFLIIFLLLDLFKETIYLIRNKLSLKFQLLIDKIVTIPTINKLICLPYRYYQENGVGSSISKLNDLSYIKEMISKCVEVLFVNILFIIFAVFIISFIHKYILLLNLFIIIIFYIINKMFLSKNFFNTYDLQINNETLNTSLVDSFNGIITIKNLSKENYFCNKLNSLYNNVLSKYKNLTNNFINKDFIQNIIIGITDFIVLYICIITKKNISTIIFIISLENIIMDSLRVIFNELPLFMNFKSIYIRIKQIFKEQEVNSISSKININNIEFKNVKYKYNDKYVINNISFDINKNDWIMVTGASGTGKTTLFKLLTKQDESNGIYINNNPLNSYSNEDIRASITYVDQKARLFCESIKDNILLGNNGLDKPTKTVMVDQLLKSNNLDYNYLIDNTNSNLSGGQIQKIIILQTLCNGSDYIIFDETTSQLDELSEKDILTNIKTNYPNKTIILITHRTSNKDLFNKIIQFDNGKIKIIRG